MSWLSLANIAGALCFHSHPSAGGTLSNQQQGLSSLCQEAAMMVQGLLVHSHLEMAHMDIVYFLTNEEVHIKAKKEM